MDQSDSTKTRHEDTSGRKASDPAVIEAAASKLQIEDLLDFTFTERIVDRRVSLAARTDLACS